MTLVYRLCLCLSLAAGLSLTGPVAALAQSADPAAVTSGAVPILDAPMWGNVTRPLVPFDTIIPRSSFCDTLTLYRALGLTPTARWSFVNGTNVQGDREKLMKFSLQGIVSSPQTTLIGALYFIRRKLATNPDSTMRAVYYGIRTTGTPTVVGGPLLASRVLGDRLAMIDIDTAPGRLTEITFSRPVVLPDSFFVGFVNPTTPGDSIGVVQTTIRCSRVPRRRTVWDRISTGAFIAQVDRWNGGEGFYSDMVVWPVIELNVPLSTPAKIAAAVQVSPVPASGGPVSVVLPGNLRGSHPWRVITSTGQTVSSGETPAGTVGFTIETEGLPRGVYTLVIDTRAGRVARRLVIE